jgi:hypothetical protein
MASIANVRANSERRFYGGMAIFMIVMVLIGFAPSFYFRGLVSYPRPNPTLNPLVLLHGIVFSAWMILFLVQARLVAADRRDVHMQLGRWGMILAIAMIPLMIAATIGQVARANQPPMFTPLGWTAVPAFVIPVFAALVWAGWRYRREPQAHKRLMLGAALMMMDPSIGRFPIFPPTELGTHLSDFAGWAPFLALFVWDWRTLGRLHWATLYGAGLLALAMILRSFALTSPLWESFAGSVVRLAGG